jgi:purine-nucleoside phosphorylase
MIDLYDKIQIASKFILEHTSIQPEIGIILGTGLGALASKITNAERISYRIIPNFPVSTVKGHKGELVFGSLNGKNVVAMSGRFHYYEGYSSVETTFPVRVLHECGIQTLIISNAAGSLNPHFTAGQIVLVRDHINLMPDHPLRGSNDTRLGLRFPDMKYAYDKELQAIATEVAQSMDYDLKSGVYVGLQGPSLETPAEYKFLNIIGGDMVGMSTVPEVIVAKHCELRTLVFSMISNVCYPLEAIKETSIDDVLEVTGNASPTFCRLVEKIIGKV